MRYIPTTQNLIEDFMEAAHKMKRSKPLKQSDTLRQIATAHGYDHWGHVMWCLKETNRRIASGFRVKASLINPKDLVFLDEVEYIIRLAELGEGTLVSLKTCLLFSTIDGDAWLLDVETNQALCLCWLGKKQSFTIVENDETFFVQYDAQYSIADGDFVVNSDNPTIGKRAIISACPVHEIAQFSAMLRQRSTS